MSKTTRYQYDEQGRLTRITHPDDSREEFHYPAPETTPKTAPETTPVTAHLPIRLIDERGGIRQLEWDSAGQLLAHTDCSQRTTHYRYDRWGKLSETTNALGERTRIARNERGEPVALSLPDGRKQIGGIDND